MRHSRSALLPALLLGLLTACGGGSAAPVPPPAPVLIQFGLVPSTVSSAAVFNVTSGATVDVTVAVAAEEGPFVFAPGSLPLLLPAGASVDLTVVFHPPSAGTFTGTLKASLTAAGGDTAIRAAACEATAEPLSVSVGSSTLDFGDVLPGSNQTRDLTVTNNSVVSATNVLPPTMPSAEFTVASPALPFLLAPGTSVPLTVRYSPTVPGVATGNMLLSYGDPGGPATVALSGTSGGQDVVDFGSVAFDGFGDTAELNFVVPDDAISFMIEAQVNASSTLGLRLLEGPGGRVYENLTTTGPYIWQVVPQYFNAQVPNTDRPNVQLVAGGGTYKLRLMLWSGSDSAADIRVIIERRPSLPTRTLGTLDLNVFLADAITPTAATATSDVRLQETLDKIGEILNQQGLEIGDIDYYDINDPTYDDVTSAEFGPMLATSSQAGEHRLNLFFVRTALGGGILGVSAALGGPSQNGTEMSGVMSLYTTSYSAAFIGLVAAHEIGHFIGLYHTVESNGVHDDILDTLECSASGVGGQCSTEGGGYLMHWQAVGGEDITNGQGLVIRGHPHLGPALVGGIPLVGFEKLFPKPAPVVVPAGISPNWCGTCRCEHPSK